ncbi:hypothetical protein BVER_01555c [Candidatus Burkholderia verschuerenii]|uniref:Uncharacterized protein n=1 Tax=Candidatus Burkholderia verschuerenii TaxID=242163 RepID=A0A0L0MJ68_9BURK|nr:hypothetical protein [Candidatus Burkholderia verschuerenii]KND62360.1 hypothetical protein BVER_01555c [Candidatus Burkholderia verschuerenii]
MRHTVIGVFDTYAQAEDTRSALISAGFPRADIDLQANPKRDDAAVPSAMPDAETHQEPGILANIERFFSMLFGGREQPPEVAHYSEAVRRGAVLVAVDTPSVEQADIARATLTDQGAVDIDERAASWSALDHRESATPVEDERDHSVLDELGLGRGSAVPGREPVNDARMTPRARAYPRADVGDPAVEPLLDPLEDPLGDPLARRDPAALSSRDYISDPADDTLMPREGARRTDSSLEARDPVTGMPVNPATARGELAGDSLSERDALAGRDALAPNTGMTEREARARQEAGTLPGVRTDMADEWRSVNDPLGPLDEPAKPNQAAPGMQSQTPGMQSQSMSASSEPMRMAEGTQATGPQTVPNEYMEYEEDFRADYDTRYATTGEPYEDYQSAYRYGATLGNDDRFRNRAWDDQMEYEMRRDWESRHPTGADTWDRFKAAIRHGWDRVTGHHHV